LYSKLKCRGAFGGAAFGDFVVALFVAARIAAGAFRDV
jgi:hypothetical protein